MDTNKRITYKCPYCGFKNNLRINLSTFPQQGEVVYCDSEEGGCDERLVLDISIELDVKIHKLNNPNKAI